VAGLADDSKVKLEIGQQGVNRMVSTKTVADLLTALRFGLAWLILWLGMSAGAEALPAAMMVLILAWITDLLDGPLARRDPSGRTTWIGDRDLETDISVSIGVLAYLTLAHYVAPSTAIVYGLLCAALLGIFRSRQLGMVVQAPTYAGIIYVALRDAQNYGLLAVGYVLLVVAATWPRFPQVVVPEFLHGMRDLGGGQEAGGQDDARVENGNGNGQRWQHR
jgi:cardiolipin synthase